MVKSSSFTNSSVIKNTTDNDTSTKCIPDSNQTMFHRKGNPEIVDTEYFERNKCSSLNNIATAPAKQLNLSRNSGRNGSEEKLVSFIAVINDKNVIGAAVGQDPWPQDGVKLYQPYETSQILLADSASCLSVQAFLKMCELKYTVEYRANAEDMSPSGRVPFIKCGAFLIAELEPISVFIQNKGISLTQDLDGTQKSDMRAYMSLVSTVLGNAENYVCWIDKETYNQVTWPRYGSVHPWPLNHILTYWKRHSVVKKLKALGWHCKTLNEVYDEVDQCCQALSDRLKNRKFFFGDKPTELDAMVFAHVFTILTTPLLNNQFAATIRCYKNLVDHCKEIEKTFFSELSDTSSPRRTAERDPEKDSGSDSE